MEYDYRTDMYRKIDAAKCTAWQVILPTGERHLLLLAVEAEVEDAIRILQNEHKEFAVQRIDVGDFIISGVHDSYSGDSRWITHDWKVTLNPTGLELASKGVISRSSVVLKKPFPKSPPKRKLND